MEDNKTLILAVLIVLVVGGVAFAFNGVTGAVARSGIEERMATICVSSDVDIACEDDPRISVGNHVYVTVDTGSEGTSNVAGFYDKNGVTYKRRATTFLDEGCGGTSCRPNRITSKNYNIPVSWSGRFCARVFDRATGKQVEDCFFIG
ncbi:MAG: hypothetical protein QGF74_00735 [Candidatus Nanoarchaeia archaeon]|jgi:hypothetical protein|nr:hypothetical protein [Candidatus Nanoarchaeia archaeon]|tara:strand:- start:4054 stop:4497 length:444 start_codon:yes stop_codon:yes gene_type:complete